MKVPWSKREQQLGAYAKGMGEKFKNLPQAYNKAIQQYATTYLWNRKEDDIIPKEQRDLLYQLQTLKIHKNTNFGMYKAITSQVEPVLLTELLYATSKIPPNYTVANAEVCKELIKRYLDNIPKGLQFGKIDKINKKLGELYRGLSEIPTTHEQEFIKNLKFFTNQLRMGDSTVLKDTSSRKGLKKVTKGYNEEIKKLIIECCKRKYRFGYYSTTERANNFDRLAGRIEAHYNRAPDAYDEFFILRKDIEKMYKRARIGRPQLGALEKMVNTLVDINNTLNNYFKNITNYVVERQMYLSHFSSASVDTLDKCDEFLRLFGAHLENEGTLHTLEYKIRSDPANAGFYTDFYNIVEEQRPQLITNLNSLLDNINVAIKIWKSQNDLAMEEIRGDNSLRKARGTWGPARDTFCKVYEELIKAENKYLWEGFKDETTEIPGLTRDPAYRRIIADVLFASGHRYSKIKQWFGRF